MQNVLLKPQSLEEAFSNALKSALGGAGPSGVNPRITFHNKFQREMEEHDQDLERKYDEDLNTTLIFVNIKLLKGRLGSDTCFGVAHRLVCSLQ